MMEEMYDDILENSSDLIGVYDKESHDRFVRNAYMKEKIEEGIEQGIKERMEQGIKKGIEQGIEQGIEKGSKAKEKELVLKMLEENIDIELISKVSGLSIKEIANIKLKDTEI